LILLVESKSIEKLFEDGTKEDTGIYNARQAASKHALSNYDENSTIIEQAVHLIEVWSPQLPDTPEERGRDSSDTKRAAFDDGPSSILNRRNIR